MGRLVSILMPCHNGELYVATAIESALAQTWPDLEIIFVDDGSSDRSLSIARNYEQRNVLVLTQKRRGAAAARNLAFAHCNGKYVKFFDADDLIHPLLIERQIERVAGSTSAVASAEWRRFCDNGDYLSTFRLSPQSVWRDMGSLDWLVESYRDARPMMQPALFLVPRNIIERCGGWDERLTLIDDFEFFSRVLSHADEVRFASGAPVYYRSGNRDSLSGRKSRAAVESAYLSLTEGTRHLLQRRDDAAARRACANMLQDFIYTYYPNHPDLRAKLAARIEELGGSDLQPDGPPRFQRLRRVIGWKAARRVQRLARR